MKAPTKVLARIASELKRFQPILSSAKARDVNESDTVTVVVDLLQYVFGYDKYSEITSEHAIRGTYCDLAIKTDGNLSFIIEVKSIGTELKDAHIKQAIDYAANQGVDWAILTNGVNWKVFKVGFEKPITAEEVVTLDLLSVNVKNEDSIQLISLLAKESWAKSHLDTHHAHKQILNRYVLGAIIMSEPIVDAIRRELRRISSDGRFAEAEIREALSGEVIKREVLEDPKAKEAEKMVAKSAKTMLRKIPKTSKTAIELAVEEKQEGDDAGLPKE